MSKFVLTAQLQLKAPNNVGSVVNNIQKQLKGVNVNVGVQGAAAANKQVSNLASNLNKADKAGQSMGKNFALSIKRFSALAIATRTVSLFTNTLSKAIDESIQFERELIKISQVTGKTTSQLKFLTDTVNSLARGLGVSSTALLGTSRMLSQAGFTAKETQIALKTLARTELAPTFENITATTEGAIAIFNQFRQGAAALEAQLGAVNAVAGQFAVEAGDLIAVIRRTGGVFKAAGGDLNELIALFTSVRSTTRESAESISTGLRTIFTRIQRPKTIEFLKQYGIELTDLSGKFVGPFEATKRLSEALSGLEQGDLSFIQIAEELGGFRQIGKVIPLLQQFRVAQDALNVAQGGSSSLADDAAKAQLALAVRIAKVKEEFLSLIRSITETTTFQVMADTALRLASALIRIGEAIKPLIPLLATFAAVKIGKGVMGFLGGMGGGGRGGAKGFNRGGPVPGSGNTDSVPAMLTPGEFVIRKKSVQSIGMDKLHAMNKYALGGTVTRREPVGMLVKKIGDDDPADRTGEVTLKSIKRGTKPIKTLQRKAAQVGAEYKFKVNIAKSQFTKSDAFEQKAETPVRTALNDGAKALGLDAAAQKRTGDKISTALGQMFEEHVNKTASIKSPGNKNFDLLRQHENVKLQNAVKENVKEYTDIKLTDNDPNANSIAKKAVNQGLFNANAKAKITEVNKEIEKRKRRRTKKRASGGGISGADTVPALLTPGEFVINKKSAQAIGRGTLNRMNTQGYNKGGSVHPKGPKRMFFGGMMGMGGGGGESLDVSGTQAALDTLGTSTTSLLSSLQSLNMALNNSSQMLNQQVQAAANKLRMDGQLSSAAHKQITMTVKKNALDLKNQNSMMKLDSTMKQLNDSAKDAGDALEEVDQKANQGGFGDKLSKFAGGLAIGATMLQSFLPPLDENSSALTKMAHSTLSFVTSIGLGISALAMFVTSLKGTAIANFVSDMFKGVKLGDVGKFIFGQGKIPGIIQSKIGDIAGTFGKTVGKGVRLAGKNIALGGMKAAQMVGGSLGKLGPAVGSISAKLFTASGSIGGAAGGLTSSLLSAAAPIAGAAAAIVGPMLLAVGAVYLFNSAIDNIFGHTEALAKAIEDGNGAMAEKAAVEKAGADAINNFAMAAAAGGATIGFALGGPVGAAIGAATGAIIGGIAKVASELPYFGEKIKYGALVVAQAFGGSTIESIKANARAQASGAKATKDLAKGAENAGKALEDFKNGNISAAEALRQSRASTESVETNERDTRDAAGKNLGNKSGMVGGFLRGTARVATLGIAGAMGLESGAQRNARIDKENEASMGGSREKIQERFSQNTELRTKAMKSAAARGVDVNDALGSAGPAALMRKAMDLNKQANIESAKGNTAYAESLRKTAQVYEQQSHDVTKAFENIQKEAEKTRKAFDAMNLGLGSVVGAAQGAAAGINNYIAAQEMGAIRTERSLATLEAGISGAAIGLDPQQFQSALSDAEATLRSFGADDEQINKMRKNMTAINTIQANMPAVLEGARETLKADLESGRGGGSLDERREAVAGAVDKQLRASGINDEETLSKFRDQLIGKNLSEDQLNAIQSGDMSVLEDIIEDIGGDSFKQLKAALDAATEAEKAMIGVIKKRQEAEMNLVNAQRKALDVQMEVMELQEEFGGKVVSSGDRVANLVKQANVGAADLGISQMSGGTAQDVSARNMEIRRELQGIQNVRMGAAAGDVNAQAQMSGASGTEMANREQRLMELNQQQAQITRKLIDEKRKEIKAIEARNKAEKDALKSLLAGDIDKFFEQQAATAATAAIASGNQAAMGQFTAQDMGNAFNNLEQMQKDGAGTFLGAQIGGAGGLLESTAAAGLSAAGISDPSAAQAMAGTDPATLALQEEARALAATLNENAQTEVDVAQKQLEAANIMMEAAQQQLQAAQERSREAMDASGMATGGVVYASGGRHIKFTPRGTDTVPAMLTPGEFVVRKSAVDRGNNLSTLEAMNSGSSVSASTSTGMSRGGQVAYMNNGGQVGASAGVDSSTLNSFSQSLTKFNNELAKNITNMQNLELKVTLNPTAINVNLQGGSFLENLAANIKQDLIGFVGEELSNYSVGNDGKLRKSGSTLGSTV